MEWLAKINSRHSMFIRDFGVASWNKVLGFVLDWSALMLMKHLWSVGRCCEHYYVTLANDMSALSHWYASAFCVNIIFCIVFTVSQRAPAHDKQVLTSVAVRYKKSISIIETVISIDYRYIDFLASYFSDRSRGIDRVGDNWRTVNASTNPHISDQLRTEYTC